LVLDTTTGTLRSVGDAYVYQKKQTAMEVESAEGDVHVTLATGGYSSRFSGRNVTLIAEEGSLGDRVTGWMTVSTAPGGVLRAEAPQDLFVVNPGGDLTLGGLRAGGHLDLFAIGALYADQGLAADQVHAAGDTITLRAYGGGVGTAEAAVRIDSDR